MHRRAVSRAACQALSALLAFTLLIGLPSSASAITIVRNFIGSGVPFPLAGGVGATVPGNAVGGGNLIDIVNAAADWWELALGDAHVFTINFGWQALGGANLGVATQFVVPQPGAGGDIRFDSDGSSVWFMDPTPHDNSEYDTLTLSSADLGGGLINTGRVFSDPNIAAALNSDLLSVAKHEIGHLLGIADFFNFTVPTLTTTGPRPNPGTVIPTTATGGGHINIATALMFPSIPAGIRKVQSGIDILAAAEVDGFVIVDLAPVHAPEPGTLPLFLAGLFGWGWMDRKRGRRTAKA